ncbi:MAG: hypothetical protein K0R94_156 [Burkholderiales bacterium]|jgi:hypothetical protein|nr:hypothetical protein [Burkholderiales bacterium]
MREYNPRNYLSCLFGILTLFLCINAAQAVNLYDQMFECIVPAKFLPVNYRVRWLVSKKNIYSAFGRAVDHTTDAEGNLLALSNMYDQNTNWSILNKKGRYEIMFILNSEIIIDAKNLKCHSIEFDQSIATQTSNYFNDDDKTEKNNFYWHDGNPLKLVEVEASDMKNGDDDTCAVILSHTEKKHDNVKTPLIPKKRSCCSKAAKMCVLL